ncbi:hypothetical protein [Lentilactobacillus kefiri]|uniref:hypothetical protein n=1 Tax=Lentilactobacillus kefiri TaxID=33962 RepID=UPI00345E1AB6
MVITINKSLFTLSIVAGFLSLSGVSASANTPKVASSDTLAAIAAKNHAALDGSVSNNQSANKDLIKLGQPLQISRTAKKAPAKKNTCQEATV